MQPNDEVNIDKPPELGVVEVVSVVVANLGRWGPGPAHHCFVPKPGRGFVCPDSVGMAWDSEQ
jgi:hypothetical protein